MTDRKEFELPGGWGLCKLGLGPDRSEWAITWIGMQWIRVTEFLPQRPPGTVLDDEMRKFADAMNSPIAGTIRYAVRAKVAKAREDLRLEAGDTVWLGDGGKLWRDGEEFAGVFETATSARIAAKTCSAPPAFMPDPLTIEIVEVDYYPPTRGHFSVRKIAREPGS